MYPGYQFAPQSFMPPPGQVPQGPALLGQGLLSASNQNGGIIPPQQGSGHHGLLDGPLGQFAPLFGLGGMLAGTGALPYMIGGLGGGMLLSHLFKGHHG